MVLLVVRLPSHTDTLPDSVLATVLCGVLQMPTELRPCCSACSWARSTSSRPCARTGSGPAKTMSLLLQRSKDSFPTLAHKQKMIGAAPGGGLGEQLESTPCKICLKPHLTGEENTIFVGGMKQLPCPSPGRALTPGSCLPGYLPSCSPLWGRSMVGKEGFGGERERVGGA